METLIYIILSTLAVSLLSFAGILFISLNKNSFEKIISLFVSLSIGTLLGGAFFHLIPESMEDLKSWNLSMGLLIGGIFLFFLMERIIRWRHCHDGECTVHAFAYLNLFGDGLHNFVDGIAIASAFILDFNLGIATTTAVFLHELPQEIGDFGVLLYGGFTKRKALFFNFVSALTAMIGGIGTFFFSKVVKSFVPLVPPVAAGGFLYIALSDLIPEFHKKEKFGTFLFHFLIIILGLLIMIILKSFSD
jgi:zinc and cadmium transporter